MQEKRASDTGHTRADLGAGFSFIYWVVSLRRTEIFATGWVETIHGQYPARGETVVYVFLSQSTFID